jgi:hypothetical protein
VTVVAVRLDSGFWVFAWLLSGIFGVRFGQHQSFFRFEACGEEEALCRVCYRCGGLGVRQEVR